MKYSKYLLPTVYIGVIAVMIVSVVLVISGVKSYLVEKPNYNYTLDEVFTSDILPVVKTESYTIIKPYVSENVTIGRYFYNPNSEKEKQESSIIYYENTYMQNMGVDYVSKEEFDIVSILDGEVESIEDNEIYDKKLVIKYNDNLKAVYSNIKDILVSVGYKVSQGEIIATSTNSKIDNNPSLLHFEVYYKGEVIDPESLYTMSVNDLEE